MPSDTDLPTLKARLRDLLERATPRPWKAGRHGGEIAAAGLPHEPQVALACGQAAMNDERSSTPEVQRANAELITAAVNALPALLDDAARRRGVDLAPVARELLDEWARREGS